MATTDPSEIIKSAEPDRESRERTPAALIIAILAALLAISSYGGSNATKNAMKEDIAASNLYAFYQARKIRHTAYLLAADNLQNALLREVSLGDIAKAETEKLIQSYRKQAIALESKPSTNDGMQELLFRVQTREKARDEALTKDPYFDYSAALMQIAVIVVSVSVITGVIALLWGGIFLGGLGFLSMLNGFFLFFS